MTSPITELTPSEQQHMLFLFIPVKKGSADSVNEALTSLKQAVLPNNDIRASTGVHFFMFYHLAAGKNAGLPIPSFQALDDRGLFVVQSIYDADFAPYISSFVEHPIIAFGLNAVLAGMDETGLIDPEDPTSAVYILANGGVQSNPGAFNCLLMRYNFADPTIPAAISSAPNQKYVLGSTFPGLTVGRILQKYPDAQSLWPSPAAPITFDPSVKPSC
ncbi:hypothetical protein [Mucilaginibacter sp.]|uniref:hypothetical protein n=1 Tax=Mucilaginibacter sp. TaxID=1882438 RepID=UPI0025F9BA35|nr:hypothetical protein [Mucilaginibacter sp.]